MRIKVDFFKYYKVTIGLYFFVVAVVFFLNMFMSLLKSLHWKEHLQMPFFLLRLLTGAYNYYD